jgi:hypothetical protein
MALPMLSTTKHKQYNKYTLYFQLGDAIKLNTAVTSSSLFISQNLP